MLLWILLLSLCLGAAIWAASTNRRAWTLVLVFTGVLAVGLYPDVVSEVSKLWSYAANVSIPAVLVFAFACLFARTLADMSDWTVDPKEADEMKAVFVSVKK